LIIIAEIGTAHRGSLKKAEQLICWAAKSGADTAKFQIVIAREILHPRTGSVPLPGGATPLYEVFESLEKNLSFYQALKDMTEAAGLHFLATPFGLESADLLKSLKPDAVKIASPEVNYTDLLCEIAGWKLPVILSSGVSRMEDLEEAVGILGRERLTLLHCVTSYPAPENEYNLSILPLLKETFQVPVGVSDHSLNPSLVPCVASGFGSVMIEKHFTLSREEDGLDDPIALEPDDFRLMSERLRELDTLSSSQEKWKRLSQWFSPSEIEGVRGTGAKKLAPSEVGNYGRTNRSIHASIDLPEGTVLTRENCCVVRTEKILTPGMHPRHYRDILGLSVNRNIPSGEGIQQKDLLNRS
jgi:N-acetylneuraminate synthase